MEVDAWSQIVLVSSLCMFYIPSPWVRWTCSRCQTAALVEWCFLSSHRGRAGEQAGHTSGTWTSAIPFALNNQPTTISLLTDITTYGQSPLHQFPRSKSITSWRLPRCVANKFVTGWCGQKSVVSCRFSNSITTTCCQQVGNFPIYGEVTEKHGMMDFRQYWAASATINSAARQW